MNPVVFARRESEGGAVCVSIDENCRFFAQLIEKVQPKLSLQATPQYLISMHFNDTDYAPTDEVSKFLTSRKKETDQLIVKAVEPATSSAVGTALKRTFDRWLADASDELCTRLVLPCVPIPTTASDLKTAITAPLPQKIPVPEEVFHLYCQKFSRLRHSIEPASGVLPRIFGHALECTIQPDDTKGGENMMHSPIDILIRYPLQTMAQYLPNFGISFDRNRTDDGESTIKNCRPDFLLRLQNLLVFWGEEKAAINAGQNAKSDLDAKLALIRPVYFGGIQFMICYAADGNIIRFYAADGSPEGFKKPDRFIPLTNNLDMSHPLGRIDIIWTVINIARVLWSIKDLIPEVSYPFGKTVKFDKCEITFNLNGVQKKVLLNDLPYCQADPENRIGFLQAMYEYAKDHRGLVQVDKNPRQARRLEKKSYIVTLKTMGVSKCPKDEESLKAMTKDLICGLTVLHEGGFLHRDIRATNIVFDPVAQQFALIDFEHGGSSNPDHHWAVDDSTWLNEWDDGTLDDDGNYTALSDMYQLGKMLSRTYGHLIISADATDFVQGLMQKNMSAEAALEHRWIVE